MAEQKPPSLFAQRPRRRARMIIMVVGSCMVHGVIWGLAELRPTLKSFDLPPEVTEVKLEDEPVQELIAPLEPPDATPEPTPPMPDETPPPEETPPPPEDPEMAPPDATPTPTPAEKKPPRPKVATPYPANVKRGPVPQAGVVGGVPSAAKTAGTPGGGGGGKWSTPKPPYPYQARASHVQGSGSVRVTTDGSGRVISAVIAQSVGNGILDSATVSFAKANWKGPPSSTTTVPITYKLQ